MKSLIILFADNFSSFGFEKSFDGKSAFEKTLQWAESVKSSSKIEVFCHEDNKNDVIAQAGTDICVKSKKEWTNEILFSEISDSLTKTDCDYALFNFAFNPFTDLNLTEKLVSTHENFKSEYSFADGYPSGVCPEILDKGLVKILSELIKTKEDLKNQKVTRTSIFDLIKTDINSFEIETEISTNDWRLLRLDFSCDKKENYLSCINLFDDIKNMSESDKADIQKICEAASKNVNVLKTIPGYFNIQISKDYQSKNPYCAYSNYGNKVDENMTLAGFKNLIKKINDFNPDAVVSLSLWGDPVIHPEFFEFVDEVIKYPGLTALIETDGFDFNSADYNSDSAAGLKKLKNLSDKVKLAGKRKNGFSSLIWIVNVDAMTQQTYEDIHPGMNLENAVSSVKILNSFFEGNVYAQFLRILKNESELESFYRTYKEKDSISNGNFIIAKYDHFCKKMPEIKSADLAPVDRNPCWHLRRDFNVLADGTVPLCREKSFESDCGNALNEELPLIWKKFDSAVQNDIDKKYCEGCSCCDEYYTFNF